MKLPKNIKETFVIAKLSKLLLFIILPSLFYSCSQNTDEKASPKKISNTLYLPQITLLANLPDSNKPKEILLAKPPKSFIDNTTRLPMPQDAQANGFFAKYTTDNGLALDQVYCIYTDKEGNLWIGTNGGGVSKYDGKTFTNYTTAHGLANNVVWTITEDKDGNIWFGTDGSGASRYDGKRFTNYSTLQGLPNNVVRCILKDKKGMLWFATDGNGVSKYDGKTFTNYSTAQGLASNVVFSITEDTAGNIWFGTMEGVSKYNGKYFSNYTILNGLASNDVRSILRDSSGNIWFGTNGGGASRFDGKNFINYTMAEGLADNVILSITKDGDGNLWFGTLKGGVSKYDGKKFINYTKLLGLEGNSIRSIVEDKTGNIWFGTGENGICKYAGKSFTNFTKANGLASNIIWSITEDKTGNLWFGTSGGGINKYDGNFFTNYTTKQGLAANVVYCTAKDKAGNLWFGTSGGGVSKYDGRGFTNYTTEQGLSNNTIFCITEDKGGNLWFGTSGGGVSKYDGKKFTNYTTNQGLANNVVYNITQDRNGNLWFGTFGGGTSRYDGKSFVNLSVAQGLANNVVWTIKEDKSGDLWFGTQNGLNLVRSETLQQLDAFINKKGKIPNRIFETFTTEDGLPDNFVTQVLPVSDKKIYIGTNHGICELIPAKKENSKTISWVPGKIFNSSTGYPVKDVNAGPGAMFKDSKDILWIGTSSDKTGLVRFDPQAIINTSIIAPVIVIQNIKINNQSICWNDLKPAYPDGKIDSNSTAPNITEEVNTFGRPLSDIERDLMLSKFSDIKFDSISKWYPIPQKLVLTHQHNEISFVFNAVETGKNFMVRYQYMLVGYDKEWSPLSNNTSATYGNMFEGKYTFKLKAQSPSGVWSEPLIYSFKVLPPWWRTWLMYAVYTLLITGIIFLFVLWKNRRILYQKKILEHKVAVATKQIREEKEKVEAQKKETELALKELESAQAQLIQTEKMASLGELTAGIAHEIQNPLNFVNNFSEVSRELLDELKPFDKLMVTAEQEELLNDIDANLEKINHHGKRAGDIVKGMLQHSRSSSGVKEPTDINALCDEYLRLSYHGLRAKDKSFNATMKTDFDASLEKINIIPQDIGRVILNLLTNAFYAVDERLKAQVDIGYTPTVSISTKKLGNKIEISVSDNGNGIPQKVLDKIFQPFFTTKPTGKGTGLGLSLSYDIVKAHGGEIKVETNEENGTTFIIQLPNQ